MLLEIRDLAISFRAGRTLQPAVDGLSLSVAAGQTVGLVGESGCGKTVSALAVLGLLPPAATVPRGSIRFDGAELLTATPAARRALRGARIALIAQDPLAALNPVHPVGAQVAEVIRLHGGGTRAAAWARAVEALREVGLPDPAQRAHDYPHQLSGGQRQRVGIAMAIACRPALLIADEPTTALDVSVQAQILDLLRRLQAEHRMGLLLITHDLGIVAELADQVTVMRAGRVVEQQAVGPLFAAPREDYTKGLLAAVPRIDRPVERLASV
ncbi:MAG: ABC transporter ATP-binding protein [Fimbriimonadaceae bacterium]|nr:ABC transporter ATP-binding protein [Fimbriimonadaceae bacterium]